MENMYGMSLYCGLGYSVSQIKEQIDVGAEVGINTLFTSLQLPEANADEVLRDFPQMTEYAHSKGMKVEADIAHKTADMFGIDIFDLAQIKALGVDYARIDGGYTLEQLAEATHNGLGMEIVLNAVIVNEEKLKKLEGLGINKSQAHFCHNFYPMKYTGLQIGRAVEINSLIHKYGYRVTGFIPSNHHKRIGVSRGLPTVERHRNMDTFTAIEECKALGFDDIFFGDDLASREELSMLVNRHPDAVTFRYVPEVEDEIAAWLDGRDLRQIQNGIPEIIRSHFNDPYSIYKDGEINCVCEEIKKGDVLMCKKDLLRYSGEVQLARMDLPKDESIGRIGRIIDEDIPLLESFKGGGKFRLIKA